MKHFKAIIGTVAVIFSIQPLATWAATPTNKVAEQKGANAPKKEVSITIAPRGDAIKPNRGGPICPGG